MDRSSATPIACICATQITLFLLLILGPCTALAEDPLPQPTGKVVLEISGIIDRTSDGEKAMLDRTLLNTFEQHTVSTETPWTDGVTNFSGPLLNDLLTWVGANGKQLEAVALNDYRVTVPVSDAVDFPVIVAIEMNGKPMRIRNRGPAWLIYPWDLHPELHNETYYARSIWQLSEIVVAE